MRLHVDRRLLLVGVTFCAGCMPEMKVDARIVDAVQVSKSEPGPWCRALGAVEGGSDIGTSGYVSAYDSVRNEAAQRGGNYVVIDHVAGDRMASEAGRYTVIGGRVFACPLVDGAAHVRVLIPDPPEQVSDDSSTLIRPEARADSCR